MLAKLLNPKLHGWLVDYPLVVLLFFAPNLFDFGGPAATLSRVLAFVHLGMTLCTAFPPGLVKVIPFKIHGYIELGVVFLLALSPWIFNFDEATRARNFFLFSAALVAVVVAITNYRAPELEGYRAKRLEARRRAHV